MAKYNVQEFSELIKTKYPEYKDIEDTELTTLVLNKWPEYKSVVTVEENEEVLAGKPEIESYEVDPEQERKPLTQIDTTETIIDKETGEEVEVEKLMDIEDLTKKDKDKYKVLSGDELGGKEVEEIDHDFDYSKLMKLEETVDNKSTSGDRLKELRSNFVDEFNVPIEEVNVYFSERLKKLNNKFKEGTGISVEDINKMDDDAYNKYFNSLNKGGQTVLKAERKLYLNAIKKYNIDIQKAESIISQVNEIGKIEQFKTETINKDIQNEYKDEEGGTSEIVIQLYTTSGKSTDKTRGRFKPWSGFKKSNDYLKDEDFGADQLTGSWDYRELDEQLSSGAEGNSMYDQMARRFPDPIQTVLNPDKPEDDQYIDFPNWKSIDPNKRVAIYIKLFNRAQKESGEKTRMVLITREAAEYGTDEAISDLNEKEKKDFNQWRESEDILPRALWLWNEEQAENAFREILPDNWSVRVSGYGDTSKGGKKLGDQIVITAPNGKTYTSSFDWGADYDEDALESRELNLNRNKLLRFIRKNSTSKERDAIIQAGKDLANETEVMSNTPPTYDKNGKQDGGGWGLKDSEKYNIEKSLDKVRERANYGEIGDELNPEMMRTMSSKNTLDIGVSQVQEAIGGSQDYEKLTGIKTWDRLAGLYKNDIKSLKEEYGYQLMLDENPDAIFRKYVDENGNTIKETYGEAAKGLLIKLEEEALNNAIYIETLLQHASIKEKRFEKMLGNTGLFAAQFGKYKYGASVLNKETDKVYDSLSGSVKTAETRLENLKNAIFNNPNSGTNLIRNFYEDPNYEFKIRRGEPIVQSEDGRILPQWVMDKYNREKQLLQKRVIKYGSAQTNLEEVLAHGLKEKLFNSAILDQFINKDFNDLTAFGDRFWRSGVNLALKVGYGASGLFGPSILMRSMGINTMDDLMLGWDRWNQNRDATFGTPVAFDEIDGMGGFGAYSANFIAQNWAPMALSIVTYGAAGSLGLSGFSQMLAATSGVGISAGGEREAQLVAEARERGEDLDLGYIYTQNLAFSFSETFSELMFGGPLLKKFDDLIRANKSWYKDFNKGVWTVTRDKILKPAAITLPSQTLDATGESVNTAFTNIVSDKPLYEGMKESFFSSFILSNSVILATGGPNLAGIFSRPFSSQEHSNILKNNNIKVGEINNQLYIIDENLEKVKQSEDLTSEEKSEQITNLENNKEDILEERADVLSESQTVFEDIKYSVTARGIKKKAAEMYAGFYDEMSKFKGKAETIQADSNLTNKEKKSEIEKLRVEYDNALKAMNLFSSTAFFGHGFLAMKGSKGLNLLNKSKRTEYNNIRREAEAILRDKNPEKNKFTEEELTIASMRVYDEKQFDLQNEKAKKTSKKYKLKYEVYNTEVQAKKEITKIYNEAIEKETDEGIVVQLQEELKEVTSSTKGSINGWSSDLLKTEFVIKENSVNNQKNRTWTHELTHRLTRVILRKNPTKFNVFSAEILKYLEDNQPELLVKMKLENSNLEGKDNKIDNEELISTFFEEMSEGNINIDNSDVRMVYFGTLLNESLNEATNGEFDVDFSGGIDIANFFESLGQKTKGKKFDKLLEGYSSVIEKGAEVIEVIDEVSKKPVEGKMSKTELDLKETFDKITGPAENRKFKSKEEFSGKKASDFKETGKYIKDPAPEFWDGLLEIEQANTLDGSIANTVSDAYLDMNPDFIEKVKKEIGRKYEAEYKADKNSLFGWLTGKNISGQTIIQLAAGNIQNKNKKQPSTASLEARQEVLGREGTEMISDEISPEDYTDIKLAQDKLKDIKPQQSAIVKKIKLTEEELNLAKRSIINFLRKTNRSPMTDTKKFFKEFIDDIAGKEVQPGGFANVIYDKLSKPKDGKLSTKNREQFIRDIAEDLIALNQVDPAVMRRSKWKDLFYELEIKNMSPAQTQKAIDEGRVPSTTNLKSGLDLFKTLNPTPDQVVEYLMKIRPDVFKRKMPKFLAEVIVKNEFNEIVDNLTQPVYTPEGKIKKDEKGEDVTIDLSESITPEESKLGKPKIEEKIARPGGIKFSKSFSGEKVNKIVDKQVQLTVGALNRLDKGTKKTIIDKDIIKLIRSDYRKALTTEFENFKEGDNIADVLRKATDNFLSDAFPIGDDVKKKIKEQTEKNIEVFTSKKFADGKSFGKALRDLINNSLETVRKLLVYEIKDIGHEASIDILKNRIKEVKGKDAKVKMLKDWFRNESRSTRSFFFIGLTTNAKLYNYLNSDKGLGKGILKELGFTKGENYRGTTILQNGEVISGYLSGTITKNNLLENKDRVNKEADEARVYFDGLMKYYLDKIKSAKGDTKQEIIDDAIAHFKLLTGDQSGNIRKLSKAGFIELADGDKKYLGRDVILEHQVTISDIFKEIEKKLHGEPNILNDLLDNATVNVISKKLDKFLEKETGGLTRYEAIKDKVAELEKLGRIKYSKSSAAMDAIGKSEVKASEVNARNLNKSGVVKLSKSLPNSEVLREAEIMDKALNIARDPNAPVKKIRVFDFDDTLARTKSKVFYTMPDEVRIYHGGSVNTIKDIDGISYFSESQDQAKEYAKGNEGKVQSFIIKENNIASEDIVYDEINRLNLKAGENYDVNELNLYELIDLKFDTSLSKSDLNKLIDSLKSKGLKAVRFRDMNLQTLKNDINNIMVFDKNVIQNENKLTAEGFAKRATELKEQGAEFDFSDFDKVVKGKKGPLFEVAQTIANKRGTEDLFVLTARGPNSTTAIKEFLDGIGLDIPLKNITGLGDGSPLAKSGWIVEKASEGYNDFYFADDHLGNVDAVDRVMSVIDVKSKTQQAKIKFSKTVDQTFNDIIEQKTGIETFKEYSAARARTIGANKGKLNFLTPPSADDFTGLLYRFLGKGKVGDEQMAWFKEHLLNPFARAMENVSNDRVQLMNDFTALKKELVKSGAIPKNLKKKAIDNFTKEDIIRVVAWNQQEIEIEGLSKRDLVEFKKYVEDNPGLQLLVDQLININKGDGYAYPGKNWLAGTITTDLIEGLNTTKRSKYLQQWQENVNLIFSEKNLNKVEAAFGSRYREALEDSLRRMKTGRNRKSTGGRLENRILDYINNSIGTVMFLNMRSGVLQTISSINFMNWGFNNPLKAGKAFANQKQYWKDWMHLMNSDYLVDRRNGLRINVSESEIADAARGQENKSKAVIAYLLKKGFAVTQIMDSVAIASGGATFYRNKIKDLIKRDPEMELSKAEEIAFTEFYEISEESQQSSRPDRISQQQASGAGRVILAFANTPMQYNRIIKKATLDLVNGRGDYKTNLSKIVYYGMVQNVIFSALQQAIFAIGFDDEEEEANKEKYYKIGNSMIDNLLRGLGIGGQAIMTGKNLAKDVYKRYQKSLRDPDDYSWFERQPNYEDSAWKLLDFSPPLSIKLRKLVQAAKNWEYNEWKHDEDPWGIDDPAWLSSAYVISSITNVPLDRLVKKITNVRGAVEADQDWWKRVALLSGWQEWELETSIEKGKRRKIEKTDKADLRKKIKEEELFRGKSERQIKLIKKELELEDLKKDEQVKVLKILGLSDDEVEELNYEEDRISKIMDLYKEDNKNVNNALKNQKDYKPSEEEVKVKKIYSLKKDEQVERLKGLGLSSDKIKELKYEEDRVNMIIKLESKKKKYKPSELVSP